MRVDNEPLASDHVDLAVETFRMLADPTRVRLLRALSTAPGGGELAVNDLAEAVGKRPSTVSQHLAKLRLARLVTTRRKGVQVMYRVTNEHVSLLVADALRHAEHVGSGVPAHHQAERRTARTPG